MDISKRQLEAFSAAMKYHLDQHGEMTTEAAQSLLAQLGVGVRPTDPAPAPDYREVMVNIRMGARTDADAEAMGQALRGVVQNEFANGVLALYEQPNDFDAQYCKLEKLDVTAIVTDPGEEEPNQALDQMIHGDTSLEP